jgi:hypothetical protein
MRIRLLMVAVAAATAVTGVAAKRNGGTTHAMLAEEQSRRECPHDWRQHGDSTRPHISSLDGTHTPGLPGSQAHIPEFNDCQRLLVVDRRRVPGAATSRPPASVAAGLRTASVRFGPYAAVFASQFLDQLERQLGGPGRQSLAAAEIWSEADYAPLGITSGQNCLYVFLRSGEWGARMIHPTTPLSEAEAKEFCTRPLGAEVLSGYRLTVQRSPNIDGLGFDDYPPVARWDWDNTTLTHYVGIKCGARWCEIGQPGFAPSPGLRVPAGLTTAKERRVWLVKGWYDQQYLATLPAETADPVPTSIRGTIVPLYDLQEKNDWGLFEGKYQDVASILLEPTSSAADAAALAKYEKHFGFRDWSSSIDVRIALCYGTLATCAVDAAKLTDPCMKEQHGDDKPGATTEEVEANRWYSRITVRGDPTKYQCIARYGGPEGGFIPGTVRWRWKVDDDGGWMRCLHGCCELL